ncbi:hypothetical protein FISHEDRAFT_59574 [Fistulina hepatica ATCC 64428]|uniref:Uncharacterized protein n=1 Tax=Fistulina hepatica ATCC 64428 TaxID=1128425 RepID=A0A0D7ACE5_9AGAR|nr:hypothetical protein FISHEDRAFT_59574 [Fistulina hepatica ATCC 64428]
MLSEVRLDTHHFLLIVEQEEISQLPMSISHSSVRSQGTASSIAGDSDYVSQTLTTGSDVPPLLSVSSEVEFQNLTDVTTLPQEMMTYSVASILDILSSGSSSNVIQTSVKQSLCFTSATAFANILAAADVTSDMTADAYGHHGQHYHISILVKWARISECPQPTWALLIYMNNVVDNTLTSE